MGLDSYIIKRCSLIDAEWYQPLWSAIKDTNNGQLINPIIIETEVAYWRKFFPLHKWLQIRLEAYGNATNYFMDINDFLEMRDCLIFQIKHLDVDVFNGNCNPELYKNDFEDALIRVEDIIRELDNKDRDLNWKYYYRYEG